MDCPRCGGPIESFQLGDAESQVCPDCGYVGIKTDHGAERSTAESWTDALARFRAASPTSQPTRDEESAAEFDRIVQNLDLPGTGRTLERRKQAIEFMYERLRRQQRATRAELLEGIDSDTLGYAHLESFWSNAGRPGLQALPGVTPPEAGKNEWRFEDGTRET